MAQSNLIILNSTKTEHIIRCPSTSSGRYLYNVIALNGALSTDFDGATVSMYTKYDNSDEWENLLLNGEQIVFSAGNTDNKLIGSVDTKLQYFKLLLENSTSNTQILIREIFE